jgi:UPF0176 protein
MATKGEQQPYRILALYKFVSPQLEESSLKPLQNELETFCLEHEVRGTLILSLEGINGTICYPDQDDDDEVLTMLQSKFPGLRTRISRVVNANVFVRLRIKVKSQIVTMGGDNVSPTETVGKYVKPGDDWDQLLRDPECLVVDARNEYEVRIGTFKGAVNPHTDNFTEFPSWLQKEAASAKRVAMFCTGGVRCEKASSLATNLFPEKQVYHLEGGILAYLDTVNEDNSLYQGECYVFDQRVAVTHGLQPSEQYVSCFACRQPLSPEERQDPSYKEGLSCLYCIKGVTEKQTQRFQDRNKQIGLALKTGKQHIHDSKYVNR